ncbi:Aste57867_490 [Aphanomyces stellatus]|uniref:Aste57867_490 protein n=1 Tax=Aphanomyces stellatus TaxID=120398 RepID=A0A485K347_9STRA|nr:hypothetical protein As57867_000489 [Aphanomyces stellatus]VFT77715.1 Aste57867_490 [Aphanomyces stellatus]
MADTALPPQIVLLDKISQLLAFRAIASFGTLGIADHLAAGPATATDIAQALRLHANSTFRLLRACANAGVVSQSSPLLHEAVFALTPMGDCMRSDVPGSVRHIMQAMADPGHWRAWENFDAAVQTGEPATFPAHGTDLWSYFQDHPTEEATFSAGMQNLAETHVAPILDAYGSSFDDARVIVDVGGSLGNVLAYALTKAPLAHGILFDLPAVIDTARAKLDAAVVERTTFVGGDFFEHVPSGDLYLLKFILHDWHDDKCDVILANVVKAASKGAKVLAIEMVLPSDVEPAAGVGQLLSPGLFLDMAMLGSQTGRERTADEYVAMYAKAGIRFTRVIQSMTAYSIVEGIVE